MGIAIWMIFYKQKVNQTFYTSSNILRKLKIESYVLVGE